MGSLLLMSEVRQKISIFKDFKKNFIPRQEEFNLSFDWIGFIIYTWFFFKEMKVVVVVDWPPSNLVRMSSQLLYLIFSSCSGRSVSLLPALIRRGLNGSGWKYFSNMLWRRIPIKYCLLISRFFILLIFLEYLQEYFIFFYSPTSRISNFNRQKKCETSFSLKKYFTLYQYLCRLSSWQKPHSQHGSSCYLPHAQQTEVGLQSCQQQPERPGSAQQLWEISQGGFYEVKKEREVVSVSDINVLFKNGFKFEMRNEQFQNVPSCFN